MYNFNLKELNLSNSSEGSSNAQLLQFECSVADAEPSCPASLPVHQALLTAAFDQPVWTLISTHHQALSLHLVGYQDMPIIRKSSSCCNARWCQYTSGLIKVRLVVMVLPFPLMLLWHVPPEFHVPCLMVDPCNQMLCGRLFEVPGCLVKVVVVGSARPSISQQLSSCRDGAGVDSPPKTPWGLCLLPLPVKGWQETAL